MTEKEKFIELITELENNLIQAYPYTTDEYRIEATEDHLIANGVTIADKTAAVEKPQWIPVTERLPERTTPPHDVLVYHDLNCGMFVDRAWYSYDRNRWRSHVGMKLKVTHWMPLPEPPEGKVDGNM